MKHGVRVYQLKLTFIVLIAFIGQIMHGGMLWSSTMQNSELNTTKICVNKEIQNNLTFNQDIKQTSESGCNTVFNLIFALKQFSLELTMITQHKEAIISYQNIQEQVFVTRLLDPPRA